MKKKLKMAEVIEEIPIADVAEESAPVAAVEAEEEIEADVHHEDQVDDPVHHEERREPRVDRIIEFGLLPQEAHLVRCNCRRVKERREGKKVPVPANVSAYPDLASHTARTQRSATCCACAYCISLPVGLSSPRFIL